MHVPNPTSGSAVDVSSVSTLEQTFFVPLIETPDSLLSCETPARGGNHHGSLAVLPCDKYTVGVRGRLVHELKRFQAALDKHAFHPAKHIHVHWQAILIRSHIEPLRGLGGIIRIVRAHVDPGHQKLVRRPEKAAGETGPRAVPLRCVEYIGD